MRPVSIRKITFWGCITLGVASFISFHTGLHTFQWDHLHVLWFSNIESTEKIVLFNLRIPRTLLAISVGSTLGLAGVFMQTATRNPLAEPGLTGVNAGAAAGVVLAMLISGSLSQWLLNFSAIAGAFGAMAMVFIISMSSNLGKGTFLLTGAAIGALSSALTQSALIIDERAMEELLFWLAGGFADRSVSFLPFLVVITGCTWITAAYHQAGLDLLLSGERQAQSLGLPVKKMQFYLLCASALLAGLCVALSGPVAFVGLIAPHLARWLGAKLHKQLLLLAPLCGAILCVVADILARFMIAPAETPISAMIAIVGSPLLVVLIHRSIRENKI